MPLEEGIFFAFKFFKQSTFDNFKNTLQCLDCFYLSLLNMAINQTSNEVKKSKMERVKKFLKYFRNKYLLTMTLFTLYALFLDDQDMFTLIVQKSKLNKIEADQVLIDAKLAKTTRVLKQLNYTSELERYAREEKLFKKDDEDIFIISNE